VRAAYTLYQDTTGWQASGPPAPTAAPPAAGQARVRHALARLSAEQRLAIELIYLDGHPHETVALLMARSVPTVQALERLALRHLHADLAAIDGPKALRAAADRDCGLCGQRMGRWVLRAKLQQMQQPCGRNCCPVSPKAAYVRPRLRVILRRSELRCESLPVIG
jgi:hypothetical protein